MNEPNIGWARMRSLLHAFLRGVRVALVSALIASAAWALPVAAQHHSGGSFGGHHFGGSHHYGGGGGHYGGGGSFGGRSHYGGGHYGHGHGGVEGTLLILVLVALYVLVKVGLEMSATNPHARRVPPGTSPAWMQVDITRVRIALAADARPFLQKKLIALARKGDTSSKRGLQRLLVQVCRALLVSESAWLYASVDNRQPMSTIFARTAFDKLAQDARTVFTHEVIRAANGKLVEGPTSGIRGSKERDGEGVIVVTFVVAAKCVITDVHKLHVDWLRRLLDELTRMSVDEVVALEVSWMPAEENDLVSTAAVEKLFPKMTKLPGVEGGHRICAHCKGPHTAELTNCPHCGAPVRS